MVSLAKGIGEGHPTKWKLAHSSQQAEVNRQGKRRDHLPPKAWQKEDGVIVRILGESGLSIPEGGHKAQATVPTVTDAQRT